MQWTFTVYHFTLRDAKTGDLRRSARRALPDKIKALGGTALPETALDVDIAQIDPDGFLKEAEA